MSDEYFLRSCFLKSLFKFSLLMDILRQSQKIELFTFSNSIPFEKDFSVTRMLIQITSFSGSYFSGYSSWKFWLEFSLFIPSPKKFFNPISLNSMSFHWARYYKVNHLTLTSPTAWVSNFSSFQNFSNCFSPLVKILNFLKISLFEIEEYS